MMCYEMSCRLCLGELTDAPIDCSTISELFETVKTLFDVEINETDNIRCICNRCFDYVMGYRALKQKITECQKIIEDYENVKKKVMETRRARVVKQEVIDVETVANKPPDTNRHKSTRPSTVTDFDINDILALVHDRPARPRTTKTLSALASSIPISIKTERQSPPSEVIEINDTRSPSLEPISSTSKDLVEKPVENEKLCNGTICSSMDVPTNNTEVSPKPEVKSDSRATSNDANVEAVTSSVETPNEKERIQEIVEKPKKLSRPRKRPLSSATVKSPKTLTESPNNENHSKSDCVTINCSHCSLNFTTDKEFETHVQKKHKRSMKSRGGRSKSKDGTPSSTGSRKTRSTAATRSRGGRNKRSTTGKNSPKTDKETTVASVRRSSRVGKLNETPNISIAEPQQTSTPVVSIPVPSPPPLVPILSEPNATATPELPPTICQDSIKSELSNNSSTFSKDISLNKSEKKRIITITLVRTKDSLNFRYCDQFRRNIDFHTVSAEEIEDIRKSLMIPEIWTNLCEAFRNSPPDEKTVEQLKTILGDEYVMV